MSDNPFNSFDYHMKALDEEIDSLRAQLASARKDALEEAAQMAADFETVFYQRTMPANDPHECAARAAREIAAAIRAAAKEVKP
jgi:hypothetical protein